MAIGKNTVRMLIKWSIECLSLLPPAAEQSDAVVIVPEMSRSAASVAYAVLAEVSLPETLTPRPCT